MTDLEENEFPQSYRWLLDLDQDLVMRHTSGVVRELVELIGVEAALLVIWRYQGLQFYMPKFDRSLQELRDMRIHEEFNGANYAELARRYCMSERHIRHIVAQDRFRQVSMFG